MITRDQIEAAAAALPLLTELEEIRARHEKWESRPSRFGDPPEVFLDRARLLRLVDVLRLELRLRLSDDAATAHDDAIEVMRYVSARQHGEPK
jgi:hypothetical protein